jgi:mannose-1-phosphate guanylyltransferase
MDVTHAMVLCAGLGTRLRPLTDERPKPLIPVSDRPLASYALDALAAAGVRHVVANAYHLAAQIAPGLAPWADQTGLDLKVLEERTLLGTGGGIRNALPRLGDDFIVFNGDVLAAPDLRRAVAAHREAGAWMTLVLREDPRAERLGAIEVDAAGRVRRILGEGAAPAEPVRRCLFTGIYVVSRRVADDLPVEGCVVRHTLRRLLARGEEVRAVVDDGVWHDLGTPASYAEAQFAMLRGELRGLGPAALASVLVGEGAGVGEGVRVEGPAVIGRGAVITGEGALSRAIVWDGAAVRVPAADVIVARHATVPLVASR